MSRFEVSALIVALAALLGNLDLSMCEDVTSLSTLRERVATSYGSAKAHCAVAKHYIDNGDRLVAFYILENLRRRIATPDEFHAAFDVEFRKVPADTTPAAEAALIVEFESRPDDVELLRKLSELYAARSDWKKAQQYVQKVIQLQPGNFVPVTALAHLLRREERRAEADRVINEFIEKHPDSEAAWSKRVLNLLIDRDDAAARQAAQIATKKFPLTGEFDFQLGVIAQRGGDLVLAKQRFVSAAENSPDNAEIQGRTARFFLKAMSDEAESLKYYLRAYFLEPEFYDTEFAESRIRSLNWDAAAREFEKQVASGAPIEKCLNHENPVVVNFAIRSMTEVWDPKFAPLLADVMLHDDPNLRWQATDALVQHVDDSFDPQLHALLTDKDLRRRGLALYIAAHRWKETGLKYLVANLDEEAVLLRFDAVSALLEQGGEAGKKIALDYASSGREKDPWMQRVLQGILHREAASVD